MKQRYRCIVSVEYGLDSIIEVGTKCEVTHAWYSDSINGKVTILIDNDPMPKNIPASLFPICFEKYVPAFTKLSETYRSSCEEPNISNIPKNNK